MTDASRRPDRPVRLPASKRPSVPKPALPEERPRLQAEAYRDLRSGVPAGLLDDVVKAFGVAGQALADGDPKGALPYLEWAKARAPRSAVVREALGVARYQLGEYAAAASELTAYRRMTGKDDQNHLLADCARAAGRYDRAVEYVDAMLSSPRVERERIIEGLLVLSGMKADRGDFSGALQVLERIGLEPRHIEPWQPRVWYAAADLYERMGEEGQARDYLEAILSIDPEFMDAEERLAAL